MTKGNDRSVRLYLGSSERMNEVADASVSLIVTSPPYFLPESDDLMRPALLRTAEKSNGRGGNDNRFVDGYSELLDTLSRCFAECQRVLKPGGFLAVNVASTRIQARLYPLPADLTVRLLEQGWELTEEFVWRRWRGYDRRAGSLIKHPYPGYYFPNRQHEYVLLFKKPGPPIYQNRTVQEKEASRVETGRFYALEVANSNWSILPVTPLKKTIHPCPYPEELPARLIELYSYKRDIVLDPFLGSGTTGKAARLLERNFIGYEVNPDFLDLARKHIAEPTLTRERRVARFELLPAV